MVSNVCDFVISRSRVTSPSAKSKYFAPSKNRFIICSSSSSSINGFIYKKNVFLNYFFFSYKHPYQLELEEFKVPVEHLKVSTAVQPASLEDTPFVEVYTEEQLNSMVSHLQTVNELAIDLEVGFKLFIDSIYNKT